MLFGTGSDRDDGTWSYFGGAVVIRVMAAPHVRIKSFPVSSAFRRSGVTQVERMTGRADADHWFPGGREFTNVIKLLRRERSTTDANKCEVRLIEHLDPREIVLAEIRDLRFGI